MMHVRVKLYAMLCHGPNDAQPAQPRQVELLEGASLQDLLVTLKISPEEAHMTFVNGVLQGTDWKLKEGDLVGVLPAMAGG